jgi:rhodanese-related sulfurtransferase
MTLDDIAELDLAYAPPFSSANDPVNFAAFIGQNDISGYSPLETAAGLKAALAASKTGGPRALVLDVRNRGEYGQGHLRGSVNLPLDELRFGLEEVPRDLRLHLLCRTGFRSHLALRILKENGYDEVVNVTGGWLGILAEGGFDLEKE